MAQAGYTPILIYASGTATNIPTAGNLISGSSGAELAINYADGKLYYKDSSGNVQLIASKAGASGDVVGPSSATDNAIVRFDGTTGKLVQNSVVTIADSTGDISGVGTLNATTLDATNIEVTNIKAKDGTAAASIADSTGVISVTANPVLSGGTANGVLYLNGSKVATSGSALTFDGSKLTVSATSGETGLLTATGVSNYLSVKGDTGGTTLWAGFGTDTGIVWSGSVSNHPVVFRLNNSEQMRLTSTGLKSSIAGTNADPVFSYTSDTNTGIFFPAADKLGFTAGGGTDDMVLTTTGLGIGTSSPLAPLHVYRASSSSVRVDTDASASTTQLNFAIAGVNKWSLYRPGSSADLRMFDNVTAADVMTWQVGGNVGIGTSSPAYKLDVRVAPASGGAAGAGVTTGSYEGTILITGSAYNNYGVGANTAWLYSATNDVAIGPYGGSGTVQIVTGGARRATLDASGNLGLGVTPSAWSGFKAFEFGPGNALMSGSSGYGQAYFLNNAYYNGSAYIYKNTQAASMLVQNQGAFQFYNAASGTAGNAISFTQAMTLDASGRLLIGTTSGRSIGGDNMPLQVEGLSSTTSGLSITRNQDSAGGPWFNLLKTRGTSVGSFTTVADNDVLGNVSFSGSTGSLTAEGARISSAVTGTPSASSLPSALLFLTTPSGATSSIERARITSGGDFQTSSGKSVMIGGTAARATTAGTNRLDIFDGTAPVGTLANGVSFYSTAGEARVMDAAGNATLLSPHDTKTNEWIFHSKHTPTGKVLRIDVERLLKFVNDHFGLDAVQEFIEP